MTITKCRIKKAVPKVTTLESRDSDLGLKADVVFYDGKGNRLGQAEIAYAWSNETHEAAQKLLELVQRDIEHFYDETKEHTPRHMTKKTKRERGDAKPAQKVTDTGIPGLSFAGD